MKYALEGVLVIALFVTAVIWDTVTAIDVAPSLIVQLRMFGLLYAAVWAIRLTIRVVRAVARALRPRPWRVLGWLAFGAWVTLMALVVGAAQLLSDMARGALELLKREAVNWAAGLVAFVALTFLVAAIRRRRWANNIPALEAEIDKEPDPERRDALIRFHERLMAERHEGTAKRSWSIRAVALLAPLLLIGIGAARWERSQSPNAAQAVDDEQSQTQECVTWVVQHRETFRVNNDPEYAALANATVNELRDWCTKGHFDWTITWIGQVDRSDLIHFCTWGKQHVAHGRDGAFTADVDMACHQLTTTGAWIRR